MTRTLRRRIAVTTATLGAVAGIVGWAGQANAAPGQDAAPRQVTTPSAAPFADSDHYDIAMKWDSE
ncbi:hypothetical protein [Wenjunlia tyrosinilytica]|jgi:hypothetical protein|uniref:Uncharacterized protein n=1 Tax=Wenjunlia tyrosinilytica TaxID=1544741 RepID=A0A917ZV63_9ACTN|nr:hypothetical protein [Wenjunlia tyrosinilytica]GGO97109.1 hypothetical protein GCM10012280_58130 [Wenjunlia tyrosinilytica]